MEAERPTRSAPSARAGHGVEVAWHEYSLNTAGNGAYVRIPTTGNDLYDMPVDGARLEYDINFTNTGTYFFYLRYRADNGSDNSAHLSMDGQLFMDTWHLDVDSLHFNWSVAPVTFYVATAGVHTLTIHQREDGVMLDRAFISTNGALNLTGFGPNVTENGTSQEVRKAHQRIGYSEDTRTGHGMIVMEAEEATNTVYGSRTYECRNWVSTTDAGPAEVSL